MVRITTWNVNGIRNPFGYQPWRDCRSYTAMFDLLEADIVVMQELKIQKKDLSDDMVLVPGWDCYFSLPKHKKGYSGVGIYTRQAVCVPVRAEEGLLGVLCPPASSTCYRDLPHDACIGGYLTPAQVAELGIDPALLDAEGRCVVLEFPAFVLFGVYSPANSNGLRDDFRYGFLTALDTRIRNLAKMGKRVILTGDLNVSREAIDSANADEVLRQEGKTREEYLNAPNRRVFNQLLHNGKVSGERDQGREQPILWDLCREFHPSREGMFTHWEQKINARPGNFGSRIDYVLCSTDMKDWFADSNIQEGLMGSDHCPVYATTKAIVDVCGDRVNILDIMNPPGMFDKGERLRDVSSGKDVLPLSGKLLPEFNKRQSIKDMFARKAAAAPSIEGSKSKTCHSQQFLPSKPTEEMPSSSQPVSTNPLSSPEKRQPTTSPSAKKPVKRIKSNAAAPKSQSSARGQQSLKSFLAAKPAMPESSSLAANNESRVVDSSNSSNSSLGFIATTDPVHGSQSAKESWTKLFSRKPSPRCEGHREPCVTYTTKKAGVNCGRQFWICPRPLGPSGQKEMGTQWRCNTFIWASDWNNMGSQTDT